MGGDHPIAWFHFFEGGRSWYTGGGHTHVSFAEPLFRAHIEGGILWAAGVADVIRAPERTTPEVSPAAPAPAPAAAPATKPNVE
jgi:type 1 glutamine amidotransferase